MKKQLLDKIVQEQKQKRKEVRGSKLWFSAGDDSAGVALRLTHLSPPGGPLLQEQALKKVPKRKIRFDDETAPAATSKKTKRTD
jgi:hypothetical protein